MNIQWLCPLDQDKTEIGRYSNILMPYLQEKFSLDIVTDLMGFREELESSRHIKGMLPINLYNLGNSYLHCNILSLALQEPGLVILHDVSLLELSLAYVRENRAFNLPEMVRDEYGIQAGKTFDELYSDITYEWHGQSQQQYDSFVTSSPLFETFVKNAYGVVVHSEYAYRHVTSKYSGSVVKLDLPYVPTRQEAIPRDKTPPYKIVFCGHAGPNRRLQQFIAAWSKVSHPEYFRLSLYGNIGKPEEIMSLSERLGLSEYIEIVGFVDEEVLEAALLEAHLALNLRFPTMGEASASQLRYWSNSVPSMVCDVGWYGELPDDVVLKVPIEDEEGGIISILESFVAGDHKSFDCGIEGYEYLCRVHTPGEYVAQLYEFVEEVEDQRFKSALFDKRLLGVMATMCEDVHDSKLFDTTLKNLSSMVEN
jgi:glycosyltransferase involved in cell wall biosynthesis